MSATPSIQISNLSDASARKRLASDDWVCEVHLQLGARSKKGGVGAR